MNIELDMNQQSNPLNRTTKPNAICGGVNEIVFNNFDIWSVRPPPHPLPNSIMVNNLQK